MHVRLELSGKGAHIKHVVCSQRGTKVLSTCLPPSEIRCVPVKALLDGVNFCRQCATDLLYCLYLIVERRNALTLMG